MKKFLAILLAAIGLTACTQSEKTDDAVQESKVLVLYYSQTGATKAVAEEIQKQLGADIEALELETPYDGDFQQTIARSQEEMAEGTVPTVKALKADVSAYDVIFLGYPIWFGTYARPIEGLLQNEQFVGKRVVTFCTFGSGGLQSSTHALRAALPDAAVEEGFGIRGERLSALEDEMTRFLVERGFKEGEVQALPAFMEHHPVTDEEVAVYDQACADYPYPLGRPVDVAVRETPASTDYEFTTSQSQDGAESLATVYVTVGKEAGAKAEFTQVVRQ